MCRFGCRDASLMALPVLSDPKSRGLGRAVMGVTTSSSSQSSHSSLVLADMRLSVPGWGGCRLLILSRVGVMRLGENNVVFVFGLDWRAKEVCFAAQKLS